MFVWHVLWARHCSGHLTSLYSFNPRNNSIQLPLLFPPISQMRRLKHRLVRSLCKLTQVGRQPVFKPGCLASEFSQLRWMQLKGTPEVSISSASPQFHSIPRISPAALAVWRSAHVVWLFGDYVSEDENWECRTMEVSCINVESVHHQEEQMLLKSGRNECSFQVLV